MSSGILKNGQGCGEGKKWGEGGAREIFPKMEGYINHFFQQWEMQNCFFHSIILFSDKKIDIRWKKMKFFSKW
jgi:hypothetical protein